MAHKENPRDLVSFKIILKTLYPFMELLGGAKWFLH